MEIVRVPVREEELGRSELREAAEVIPHNRSHARDSCGRGRDKRLPLSGDISLFERDKEMDPEGKEERQSREWAIMVGAHAAFGGW